MQETDSGKLDRLEQELLELFRLSRENSETGKIRFEELLSQEEGEGLTESVMKEISSITAATEAESDLIIAKSREFQEQFVKINGEKK
tara:strand:+ start:1782 stop:2045 length:264 start_codon:yes stop_codon:yes gene_type:complete